MSPQKVFDARMVPRIKECLGSWTPPTTITPHLRYLDLYRMRDRVIPIDIEEQIAQMRAAGVQRAIICAADNTTTWGRKTPNEVIATLCDRYPDVFVGFAGVDPHKGMDAVREFERAVKSLGLRGLNLGPWLQKLLANDKRYYPLYAKAVELNVPVVLHTSSHFDPTVSFETGNPTYLDEVCVFFPELKVIASHAGWPWILQMIAVAWRHPNVYLELSGIRPRYLHKELVSYFDTPLLKGRVLFGTDYPLLEWTPSIEDVLQLPIATETKHEILWGNAARLFGLED
ncbi:MAG TPA: amidohydrolase family protein [bacterium]|nr:amidohydrolase family protein [bacterium]